MQGFSRKNRLSLWVTTAHQQKAAPLWAWPTDGTFMLRETYVSFLGSRGLDLEWVVRVQEPELNFKLSFAPLVGHIYTEQTTPHYKAVLILSVQMFSP